MMDGYNPAMLYMTQGVDRFNETLTDVNLEDPRVIDALERHRRWTYDYRLIPSSEDLQAEASAGGYAGGGTELLENDRVGMINGGRWHLIRFRQTNKSRIADGKEPLRFGTAEYPNGGFRLAEIGTRAAAVYVDGNRTDRDLEVTFPDRTVTIEAGAPWAVFFIAFLASEDYNAQIIADSDGLPPNPAFMRSKAYLEPEESAELGIYAETEYEIHEPHFEVAQTLAMPRSYSPFVLYSVADAAENRYRSRFLAEPPDPAFSDAAIAMAAARREILSEIRRELEQRPELREEYERRLEAQARIDEAKRTGAKIDANDIYNGFYLRYYREQGMLDESTLRPEQQGVPIAPPAQLDQTADRSPESESTSESSAVNVTEPVEEMIEDTADAPGVPIERVRDVRDELEAEPGASTESALETEPESSPMSSLQDRLRRDRVPETRPLTPLNLDRLRPSTSPATQPAD
jgi:multiple sugar transport system substrate-binding protein